MDEYKATEILAGYFGINVNSIHYEDLLTMFRLGIEDYRKNAKKEKSRFKYHDACIDLEFRFRDWFDSAKRGEFDSRLEDLSNFVSRSYLPFVWVIMFAKGMHK